MMATEYWNGIPIFDTPPAPPPGMGTGYVPPSNESKAVVGRVFGTPDEIDEYPESEWEDRLKEHWEQEQSVYHIWKRANNGRQPEIFNQGQWGYCWGYSTTNAVMFARAVANMPFERLSAHSVAWTIKNGRNEGGWCGQSAKFIADRGVVPERIWPNQGDRDYGGWDEAAKYKIDEEWRDPNRPIYGQELTAGQIVACALNNQPMACDDNEWRHSVAYAGCVVTERGQIDRLGWNSWAGWGDEGWFIARGQGLPFQPDGAIAIRSITGL